jgi:single-stranded-DNA-specific exonuclease
MAPVFVTRCVCSTNTRVVGRDALKLDLIQKEVGSWPISAIAFGLAPQYQYVAAGNLIDVCYTITENYYQGKTILQLNVKDIKPNKRDW